MMRRIRILSAFSLIFCFTTLVHAASDDVIYRQRANWVRLEKADPKDVPLGSLTHPYQISPEQMEAMLLSIKISKKYVIKKDVASSDVFNAWEARKFSSILSEALGKTDPDHVVNFSIVHKRPLFILQNDSISIGNLWVDAEGVHFQFSKLFAKLEGDYEASANMDKALRKAKTMRITLEANQGQKLSYASPTEVVLDPNYNFGAGVAMEREQRAVEEEKELAGSKGKKAKKGSSGEEGVIAATSAPAAAPQGDIPSRLRKLEDLKSQKLINEQEYQQLRKKILSEI